MILIDGQILDSSKQKQILPTLERRVCKTLTKPPLDPMLVINACDTLAGKIEQGEDFGWLSPYLAEDNLTKAQIADVILLFKKESLLYKRKLELGKIQESTKLTPPFYKNVRLRTKLMPLGVLFHIAAGNVDGLPAYSIIEGLLAGNINLLKLPSADQGFTIMLLQELIKLEPILAEYIYVFDTPSTDVAAMQVMARCADAIVVWGSDPAIEAVRRLASPNTKIIEWGHKMSFAYVTGHGMEDADLVGLANHILSTKQLLCSSCQGIYLDTDVMNDIHWFSNKFLEILDREASKYPRPGIGMQAQITILKYNQELTAGKDGCKLFQGKHCSILASQDSTLEVSYTHGNCWVKPLPRKKIIARLHRYKGYLQTVGLLCSKEERSELTELFLRAGATKVTTGADMSEMLPGESHDGVYPLRQYSRIVEYYE